MTIPAHTPTADMLTMTYGEPDDGDPSHTNMHRVDNARAALRRYVRRCSSITLPKIQDHWADTDGDGLISDLMTDLLHLATYTGCDPERILVRARRDFEAEAGLGYDQ